MTLHNAYDIERHRYGCRAGDLVRVGDFIGYIERFDTDEPHIQLANKSDYRIHEARIGGELVDLHVSGNQLVAVTNKGNSWKLI